MAIFAIAISIAGLGPDPFGILTLVWVILGYLVILDFGRGKAIIPYVARESSQGSSGSERAIVRTAVMAQCLFGVAVAVFFSTPFLATEVLGVPEGYVHETETAFSWLALSLPIVLVMNVAHGVLEGADRFGLVAAINIPTNSAAFLFPAAGVSLSLGLVEIISILLARLGALLAFIYLSNNIVPWIGAGGPFQLQALRDMAAFGGWVTVTSVIGPILVYLDRFLIASLLAISAVPYYIIPFEVATRLLIVPSALLVALFPAFSSLGPEGEGDHLPAIFSRSFKFILLALGPAVVVLALFSREVLSFWVGSEVAKGSAGVMSILVMGVLANALAYMSYSYLQGSGRPDLTGKIHFAEFVVYVFLAWFFVKQWGIEGAAAVWALRALVDCVLLYTASVSLKKIGVEFLTSTAIPQTAVALAVLAGVLAGISGVLGPQEWYLQVIVVGVVNSAFGAYAWVKLLDATDRAPVVAVARARCWRRRVKALEGVSNDVRDG
ncbi:MAG TPA: oligosaccharide flippase family protein [Candidatus Thermoplasmatota archaeon]|nr:oligosaccharide flippase family protein [Candidatus Thermoplasmatota archaeon]